jgi:hypothetical protein
MRNLTLFIFLSVILIIPIKIIFRMTCKGVVMDFEIKVGIHGVGVFVTRDIKKGDIVFKLLGNIVNKPTRTSVQIGRDKHVENSLAGHVNHSCQPNVRVNRRSRAFVSLRDIKQGEEMTFNYNDNEDVLAEPFTCACCGRRVVGKKAVLVQNTSS